MRRLHVQEARLLELLQISPETSAARAEIAVDFETGIFKFDQISWNRLEMNSGVFIDINGIT